MSMMTATQQRKARVRAKISGTGARPRLSIKVTNRHITAQVIDDTKGTTLAYVTTVKHKEAKGTMTEKAVWVGAQIGAAGKAKKVKAVVFDRGSKIYHGRLHALAEAARKAGLEF